MFLTFDIWHLRHPPEMQDFILYLLQWCHVLTLLFTIYWHTTVRNSEFNLLWGQWCLLNRSKQTRVTAEPGVLRDGDLRDCVKVQIKLYITVSCNKTRTRFVVSASTSLSAMMRSPRPLVSHPSPRPSAVAVMLSSTTWPGFQMMSRLTRHSTAKSTYL